IGIGTVTYQVAQAPDGFVVVLGGRSKDGLESGQVCMDIGYHKNSHAVDSSTCERIREALVTVSPLTYNPAGAYS
ncbi:MAG: hypothetical protein WBR18_09400, partial [Anaerolineales bacterium]